MCVPHGGLRAEPVVVDGQGRGGKGLPHGQLPLVQEGDDVGVGEDSLLFQVTHEPVAEGRGQQVAEGEAKGEDPLGGEHGQPEELAGVPQLQEDHEVHPLVLCLLQEGVDPALCNTRLNHYCKPNKCKEQNRTLGFSCN